ncbi:DUF1427 family protein [Lysobacter sp. A6]|uniref:DUF1427 family protein n=1 Tax=Noviluteimonas lactosilytica TaxID=2888523 RepID=A0ABS8JJC9_9GAMM|nr:DUF1427 family protein [Lysobacter lactosilyticus]MCC8363702.1 DUF1427 family protein [Lysobacter lactosilyticus]
MNVKFAIGLSLGFSIGFVCRWFGIPAPAPPVLVGALIVFAMTCGYVLADRWIARRHATQHLQCGGPTGDTHAERTR